MSRPTLTSPRQVRLAQLFLRMVAVSREQVDLVAGCSNGPGLVATLRKKGASLPCFRVTVADRDRRTARPGEYRPTEADKKLLRSWLEEPGCCHV